MHEITKSGKFANMEVCDHLQEGVLRIFLKMPHLSFIATKSRSMGLDSGDVISQVDVYHGNQKLGFITWESRYTPKDGYVYCYRISSRNIRKSRGVDRNSKFTTSSAALVTIAKQCLIPKSKDDVADEMVKSVKSSVNSMRSQGVREYQRYADRHCYETFEYVVGVVEGRNPTVPTTLLNIIQGEALGKARDTARIIKSVSEQLEAANGVVLKVEQDDTISVADIATSKMRLEVKSTYDLPQNYQEKFTILKIMDENTPIEHVGVKFQARILEQDYMLYYLIGGDTVTTH